MKKLIAIMFCILCAGLIFARGSSDSPSKKKAAAETHKVQEQTASEGASILDKYSDAEIEVLLANISSLTFPDGTIHNLVSDNQLITVHELEHQSQYQNGDKKELFKTLVISDAEGRVLLTLEDFSKVRVERNNRRYTIIIGDYLYQ